MGQTITMKILLREVRTSRGVGLRELSRMCGVSAKHLSDIENCIVRDMKLSTLCKIAKALQVDPCSLFAIDGQGRA